LSDKEKDSEKKIRELASEIVNELLKSNEPVSVDISTSAALETSGNNQTCPKKGYTCQAKKFKCKGTSFKCLGKFVDSKNVSFSL